MSRAAFVCRDCGHVLGHRHHTGRLHPTPGVTVYFDPKGHAGPYFRLVCPVCATHRDYRDGPMVMKAS